MSHEALHRNGFCPGAARRGPDQNAVLSGGLPMTWDLIVNDVQRSRTTAYAIGKGSVRRLLDAAAKASGGTAASELASIDQGLESFLGLNAAR
jgi:hypothetical protein